MQERSFVGAWSRLVSGVVLFGSGVTLMIRSNLGLGPWDMFHQGLFFLTGISIGSASILVGLAIFAVLWPFGVRPGWGSLVNMVIVGVVIDRFLPYVRPAAGPLLGVGYHLAGIAMTGFGTGLYVSARLGAGPRDSLMLTMSTRLGWPVRHVRTIIEVVVLGMGWLMGGTLGLGTLLFALLIGPAVQWSLQTCDPQIMPRERAATPRREAVPEAT
jgi:uncharacterized membrane protein YczE